MAKTVSTSAPRRSAGSARFQVALAEPDIDSIFTASDTAHSTSAAHRPRMEIIATIHHRRFLRHFTIVLPSKPAEKSTLSWEKASLDVGPPEALHHSLAYLYEGGMAAPGER